MLKLLDPKATPVSGKTKLAPRFGTLNGLKIGVLWNGRTYGDIILKGIIEKLKEKYHNFSELKTQYYNGNHQLQNRNLQTLHMLDPLHLTLLNLFF